MSLNLETTGNTETDISNIIDELNTQYDSDSISNALNISALGETTLDWPGTPNTEITTTITHNLGYAPVFLVLNLAVDGGLITTPYTPLEGGYHYNSGSKTSGSYPFSKIHAEVDTVNLYIVTSNLANPGSFALPAGTFTFYYYIFSRPITN